MKYQNIVIVIPGVKPGADGGSTKQLVNRALFGSSICHKYPEAFCVASGGATGNTNISEASLIEGILLGSGVSQERILLETNSSNTRQNVMFSIQAITSHLSSSNYSVIVCTERYHSVRVKLLFYMNGISVIPEPIPRVARSLSYGKIIWFCSIREPLAIIKDVVLTLSEKIRGR